MPPRHRRLAVLGPLAALLFSSHAGALTQPNGETIPQGNNLKDYLDGQGEKIDPVASVAVTPQTFDPACNLTFTVIARGGSQANSFGWYNAVEGKKPAPADLHEFLTCSDAVGTTKTLSIKADPAYKGGKIGFFMATTQDAPGNCVKFDASGPQAGTLGYLYYSENQYNDDNTSSMGFIHLVILDSGAFPKAFYFGWEDLKGGGDNDFEDLLTRVQGITCAGGGDPCDTGKPGVCAAGVTQCHDGKLACLGQSAPGKETCNGLDDDCNGELDEGKLCAEGEVCFQGSCVGKCGSGEFQCPGELVCDAQSGFCVDPACKGKQCPAGTVCKGGACKAPCEGVKCPAGLVCRLDLCVDPCAGIACDDGSVCDAGVCREKCGCGACPAGKACQPSGLCVESACAQSSCLEGAVCVGGKCIDACEGATCPTGQTCKVGKCVAGGSGGAGGSSSAGGAGGSVMVAGPGGAGGAAASGGKSGSGGAGGKGGPGGKGGVGGKGGSSNPGVVTDDASVDPGDGGTCGCRSAGRDSGARSLAALGLALGLASLGVRRRRASGR
jgi:hypothetical protein